MSDIIKKVKVEKIIECLDLEIKIWFDTAFNSNRQSDKEWANNMANELINIKLKLINRKELTEEEFDNLESTIVIGYMEYSFFKLEIIY